MRFTLAFNCDNDGFFPDWRTECARTLREVADSIASERGRSDRGDTIKDANGNTIGRWSLRPQMTKDTRRREGP